MAGQLQQGLPHHELGQELGRPVTAVVSYSYSAWALVGLEAKAVEVKHLGLARRFDLCGVLDEALQLGQKIVTFGPLDCAAVLPLGGRHWVWAAAIAWYYQGCHNN
eukprot:GILK01030877.1.p3 GENE.GILK01030877.1~~GILK01030877.1.p3  ORF type:complete len:106 (-),score=7.93 GILK01030877.1:55-372(-)